MRLALSSLLAVAALALPAVALAQPMDYFDVNDGELTFTIAAAPTTILVGDVYFVQNLTYTGYLATGYYGTGVAPLATFDANSPDGYTVGLFNNAIDEALSPIGSLFEGPVVYSGSDADPVFVPGSYTVYNAFSKDPSPETLTITAVSTVTPEPGTFALLGTGALGLFGVVRRRFV